MIRHYCDKCGKEIIENVDENVNSRVIDITRMPYGRAVFTDFSFELCNDCIEGLAEYLGTEVDWEKKDDKAI